MNGKVNNFCTRRCQQVKNYFLVKKSYKKVLFSDHRIASKAYLASIITSIDIFLSIVKNMVLTKWQLKIEKQGLLLERA